mgnify:CR=1 FL=1
MIPNCVVMLASWLQRFVCLNAAVFWVSTSAEFCFIGSVPDILQSPTRREFYRSNDKIYEIDCRSCRFVQDSKSILVFEKKGAI